MIHLFGILIFYYLLGIMALSLLGRISKRARFFARILSYYFLLMISAAYGVLASVVLRLLGKVSIAQWAAARAFKTVTCPTMGIDFNITGEEYLDTRPAVFISNHQSELDLVILGRIYPKHCSVTGKRSLKYVPFLGWLMSLSGAIFIDRGNRQSAIAAFDNAIQEMKKRQQSVFIFPEGTRSYMSKPGLLPFKKGAFYLAVQAGVPIVPIVIGNSAHVLHMSSMTFEAGTIDVRVLPPVETKGLTEADVEGLSTRVRDMMLKEIEAIGGGVVEESSKDK